MRMLALSSCVWLLGLAEPTCTPPLSQEAPDTAEATDPGACLAACAGGAKLSETDEETCRLLCEKDTAQPEREATLLTRFELCESRCEPQGKTDAATCSLNCSEAAMSSLKFSPEARDCLRPCLDAQHTCTSKCGSDSGTNAETCRLQCGEVAKSCVDACAPKGK